MKIGTKSLLFGVHQFLWHPFTVLLAWQKLYGRPTLKELFCILIHDIGYLHCPDMDGDSGTMHPLRAAEIVNKKWGHDYYKLCLFHSRHLSQMLGVTPSRLCWADKLSICYEPAWFYLLRAHLSGELKEYRKESAESGFCPAEASNREWFKQIKKFMRDQAFKQESSTTYMGSISSTLKSAISHIKITIFRMDLSDAMINISNAIATLFAHMPEKMKESGTNEKDSQ
jgi:hypothetical protein